MEKTFDVFEKIARRRRKYEFFLPIHSAGGFVTLYSVIRWNDSALTLVLFLLMFILFIIYYSFRLNLAPGKSRSTYNPEPNKKRILVLTISFIAMVELANQLLVFLDF